MEEWRVIGCNPNYVVSNLGEVMRVTKGQRTYPGKILKPKIQTKGYLEVLLSNKGKQKGHRIHTLVLEAFVSKRPSGHSANHIDGNKANNNHSNLEWVTVSQNNLHALRTGLRSNGIGETSHNAKLKDDEVWLIKKLLHSGVVSQRFIAKIFKVHFATINEIKMGHTWSHVVYL